MWLISCLFRLIPLSFLTLLWVIQTAWFWSWLASGLVPNLKIEKANQGLVPFSLHLAKVEHPLAKAEGVDITFDWNHLINTLSWRLSSIKVNNLNLLSSESNSPSPSEPPFAAIYELCERIHTCSITWQDGPHTNHFTKTNDGSCTLTYQNQTYQAHIEKKDGSFIVTTPPLIQQWSIQAVITPSGLELTAPGTTWRIQISTNTWVITDGETLGAQGTWSPQHVEGTLSHPWVGTIQGNYHQGQWHITPFTFNKENINLSSSNITVQNLQWSDTQWNIQINLQEPNTSWQIQGRAPQGPTLLKGTVDGNQHIQFEGSAPYGIQLKGVLIPAWNNPMSSQIECTINTSTPMAKILDMLDKTHVVQGQLNAQLSIQGPLQSLQYTGTIEIQDGLYHNVEFGVWLAPIYLKARNQGSNTWIIEKLTASDRASRGQEEPEGGIRGSGKITWSLSQPLQLPHFDVTLQLDEVDIAHGDRFQGDASGTLHITGTQPRVEGDLTLNQASVHLDAMDDSEGITIKRPNKKNTKEEKMPDVLPLDFTIVSHKILVDGLGLESAWSGQMKIKGFITKPYLVGVITCQKGTLNVLGIPMNIKSSNVSYIEEDLNTPQLNITATHELNTTQKVFFHVNGSSDRPNANFTSNMGLNERDIVSRLLFGQSADNISVWQSLQLANTLANINNRRNKMSWVEQMRSAFGIDSFEVKSVETETGQTAQTPSIGKRLGGLRLSVDAATGGSPGKATVETNLTPNITLNADVGGDRSSGIGADWVYHY